MKWLYGFGIFVSVFGAFFIFCMMPLTKQSTPHAISNIEERFLRHDLTAEDEKSYEFTKKFILNNQSSALTALDRVRHTGLAVCLVLLVTSIAGLADESRGKKAASSGKEGYDG